MACRKAAYRSLRDVSEWMEAQQERAAVKLAAIETQQRQVWTPTLLFDQCCSPWLADGLELLGHAKYTVTKGCSGGCGKEHPKITLHFDNGTATAVLSHELDPFVQYFDGLCHTGLARQCAPMRYELTGYLHDHFDKLQATAKFGSHLIKVSASALAASKRAHEHQVEKDELEREAKKRKTQGPEADGDVLSRIMEICRSQNLQDHLDLAEIAWLRLSCKTMAKTAAKMARSRLQQVRLSYSVLVDGVAIGDTERNSEDLRSEGFLEATQSDGFIDVERYTIVASHQPLSYANETAGTFVPKESASMPWDSTILDEISSDRSFRGHLVRVYLEAAPQGASNLCFPERNCLFSEPLEVARYRIDPRELREAGVHESSKLTFEVASVEATSGSVLNKGSFLVQSIQFDFNDLLGIYVRKKLPIEKKKMQEIRRQRPASRAEKQYVRALAKAAREAPGSSQAFNEMSGW